MFSFLCQIAIFQSSSFSIWFVCVFFFTSSLYFFFVFLFKIPLILKRNVLWFHFFFFRGLRKGGKRIRKYILLRCCLLRCCLEFQKCRPGLCNHPSPLNSYSFQFHLQNFSLFRFLFFFLVVRTHCQPRQHYSQLQSAMMMGASSLFDCVSKAMLFNHKTQWKTLCNLSWITNTQRSRVVKIMWARATMSPCPPSLATAAVVYSILISRLSSAMMRPPGIKFCV